MMYGHRLTIPAREAATSTYHFDLSWLGTLLASGDKVKYGSASQSTFTSALVPRRAALAQGAELPLVRNI